MNNLPKEILGIIAGYASEYELIDFVEKNKNNLDWNMLSGNINAIHLLERNQNKIG